MTNEERTLIEGLLSQSDEDLILKLGRQVADQGVERLDLTAIAGAAQRWLREKRATLAARICDDQSLKHFSSVETGRDPAVLVAAVADQIAAVCFDCSPFVVAVLILREGLHSFCAKEA